MHGRIWFPGNPWPDGHGLSEFAWSGRLDRRGRLWFDLHLRTLPYADEVGPRPGTDVESGWASASTWTAYDRATLSSTFWPDAATGVLAATRPIPFRFGDFRPQIRAADPLPVDPEGKPAVNLYLFGPGAAAEHEIEFTRQPAGGFTIVWTGRINPTQGGSPVFDHEFRAEVSDVEFGPVRIPDGMPAREALVLLEKLIDPADTGTRFRLA